MLRLTTFFSYDASSALGPHRRHRHLRMISEDSEEHVLKYCLVGRVGRDNQLPRRSKNKINK